MQNSNVIKFDSGKLKFIDLERNNESIVAADITSLKLSAKGLVAPIMILLYTLISFALFFATRADGNEGTLFLIYAIATLGIAVYLYMKLPSSKRYLQIGVKGNVWYFINCKEEKIEDLIKQIESYRDERIII